jgi:hypothetical protein
LVRTADPTFAEKLFLHDLYFFVGSAVRTNLLGRHFESPDHRGGIQPGGGFFITFPTEPFTDPKPLGLQQF